MLDLRRLRLLVELSRRGTIAAVAQALSYSSSTVSTQLSVLEKEAGAALLEPAGRRVRLTPAGTLLVAHGTQMLAQAERAEAELAALHGTPTGTVRLAAFQSAALALLPDVLLRLREQHPDLRVELVEAEPESALPALAAGDFDLVLAEEYPGHPRALPAGLTRQDLLTDSLHLVVPSTWAGVASLADLRERPVAVEPAGSTAHDWAVRVCREAGFEPDVVCTSTDLQIHLRMARHGLAAALLPALASAHQTPGVRVVDLPGLPVRQVFVATREGARTRPALVAVVDALRREPRSPSPSAPAVLPMD